MHRTNNPTRYGSAGAAEGAPLSTHVVVHDGTLAREQQLLEPSSVEQLLEGGVRVVRVDPHPRQVRVPAALAVVDAAGPHCKKLVLIGRVQRQVLRRNVLDGLELRGEPAVFEQRLRLLED